jgi:hypothetical protein
MDDLISTCDVFQHICLLLLVCGLYISGQADCLLNFHNGFHLWLPKLVVSR